MPDIRLTLDDELLARIDAARGSVARVRWIREQLMNVVAEPFVGITHRDDTKVGVIKVASFPSPRAGHEWVGISDKCMRMSCKYPKDRKAHG